MSGWDGIDEFVAVAEAGSFSRAAERLRVSSSHVSRCVARLEDRLQAPLFYRTTRKVSLTESGRTFLARCQRLAEQRDDAFLAVGALQGGDSEVKGLLRMTCATAYGEQFVMPLINSLMERNPQLSIEVELTNRRLDLVQEGYDLAIRLGRLSESSLVATRIAPRVMHLCAAPTYLERHGAPGNLADLGTHQCLIGTADHWLFDDSGQDWLFRPRGRWRCNSGFSVLDAALRGFGLCQLPDYYVRGPVAEGRLVSLLDRHRPPNTAVWAVYPQKRHAPPKVHAAIRHLKDGLARRTEYR
ncbi:LysR family transcriptional regulator [Azospirillum thiophilum]|uniref:LysR family transcriptional regulator n=1 Tax=Azospirillum thiophilum TaxID=528244 RepID=A0AAC8W0F5_9PROT|nr:LysR family transcriptional regulator [Azospirillum thiophilum]ALG72717.1 LysR family transcriptional regulator [Azospirillum thiophilum]KJR64365.1 LysR family transcriptional regulator [Azospirillum thiophilum]